MGAVKEDPWAKAAGTVGQERCKLSLLFWSILQTISSAGYALHPLKEPLLATHRTADSMSCVNTVRGLRLAARKTNSSTSWPMSVEISAAFCWASRRDVQLWRVQPWKLPPRRVCLISKPLQNTVINLFFQASMIRLVDLYQCNGLGRASCLPLGSRFTEATLDLRSCGNLSCNKEEDYM